MFRILFRIIINRQIKQKFAIVFLILLNILSILMITFIQGGEKSYENYRYNFGEINIRILEIKNPNIINELEKDIIKLNFNIKKIEKFINFNAFVIVNSSMSNFQIYSINKNQNIMKNFYLTSGFFPKENEILIADIYKGKVNLGDKIQIINKTNDNLINSLYLKICGFFSTTSENKNIAIIDPFTGNSIYKLEFNSINLFFEDQYSIDQLNKITQCVLNKNCNYKIQTYKTYLSEIKKSSFNVMKILLYLFALILFLIQLVLIINFNLMILEEMISDLYLFITLGARKREIQKSLFISNTILLVITLISSFILSYILIIPLQGRHISLTNSTFLSPLLGGINRINFYFNFLFFIKIYILFIIFESIIYFIILTNFIKDNILTELNKHFIN